MSTGIQWTDETWNPVVGCTRVSAGCRHCYAFSLHNMRYRAWRDGNFPTAPAQYHVPFSTVQLMPERLADPEHWRKPRMVFVNSMSDLFHELVPTEFIDRVFNVMIDTPRHTYQILTKRPERMLAYVRERAYRYNWHKYDNMPPRNIWLGVSVEDQAAALKRIPLLLETPAAVRFLSCEPLLGPVDLTPWLKCCPSCGAPRPDRIADSCGYCESYGDEVLPKLHWVIVGGESGKHYRALDLDWARVLRSQCVEAGVPFFFKQVGGVTPKANGRLLDGRTWDEMPRKAVEA